MRIMGIDPGTTTTGFAILEKHTHNPILLDYGILHTTPKIDTATKLLEIGEDIKDIIKQFDPEMIVIEKLFFQTNVKTGIAVAEARGVMLYEAIRHNIKIREYAPLQVKKAITGNGKASKIQLQNAIKMLFGMKEIPKPDDAADAIGLAYMGYLDNNSFKDLA